jgi:hypothetical protein
MEYNETIKAINSKIRKIISAEIRHEYNSSIRIFGKNKELKKYKCYECAFQDYLNLAGASCYPCCECKDRPTRKNDKSEFMEDMTDEQREHQQKLNIEEEQGKGKFNF